MKLLQNLKQKARALNTEVYALYLAYKHPKVSWVAKVVIALTIGYALSPIDLIPDFIPVFGFLDDLFIVPAGVALSVRLIPASVMQECRIKSYEMFRDKKPSVRYAWLVVVFSWIIILSVVFMFTLKFIQPEHALKVE